MKRAFLPLLSTRPGAGAEVGQAAIGHERLHRQRVEQVAGDHLLRVADGGEVVGAVPAVQQGQVAQQRWCQRGIQAHAGQALFQRGSHAGGKWVFAHAGIIAGFAR
ncbi:hypothetical protein G6F68_011733 [Rhizopus microsporus]|nr:hypothetical protein G6F68_011733 [Rhizopus microsporus]